MKYMNKILDGEYLLWSRPLKAWLHYIKQVSLGKVLNVDVAI